MDNYKMEIYCIDTTDGSQWNVEFPEVAGCGGAGKTVEEAIADAKINLQVILDFYKEEGIPIPIPNHQTNRAEYSGKISLRIPRSLHKEVARFAEKDGVSINCILTTAIANYIGLEQYSAKVEQQVDNIRILSEKGICCTLMNTKLLSQIIPTWDNNSSVIYSARSLQWIQ